MKKDLPSVYSNPIEKEIKNNTEYYYGSLRSENNIKPKNIIQQINNIFASKDFVYKKKVRVTTIDETTDVTLVGRNTTSLLTLENKTIPISNITDIEILN